MLVGERAGRIGVTLALPVVEAEALVGGDDFFLDCQLDEALPDGIQARFGERFSVLGEDDHAVFARSGVMRVMRSMMPRR